MTAGILLALVTRDLVAGWRTPSDVSLRDDAVAVGGYLLLAVLFGAAVLAAGGASAAGAFFSGWASSLAITVDALFVFLLVTSRVPGQHRIVTLGVGVAVLVRVVLVALGVPAASVIAWISVLFGVGVLWSAWQVFRHDDATTLPTVLGKPGAAPGAAVLAAAVFALFSVSATVAVTGSAYLVLCANLFALLGFHRLFRLTRNLVERVPDASVGLAVVLVFVGVKSVLTGLTTTAQDTQVTLLSLGMIAVVAALSAITAARTPSR
ncbi:TerC family protein [Saccharopolyspora sp. 5N708]|uniref:TerC family protein n=1 Tax=Saccharopolyspora sp. 5N708 TaxID=3457424 RepID=UPI003FD1A55F